jgi:hypothetical protein
MSSADNKTICSGENVNLALTSVVPSSYSWVATANANVTGERAPRHKAVQPSIMYL